MSIEALAHAAVVTGFVGPTVPDWLARRIDAGLGGVCWFAQNVADHDQATKLAAELHGLGPVLVMSDEEGGDVTRLEAATGSSYPAHAALGALDDAEATRRVAAAMGGFLAHVGIDVALAPVVDVNADPRNPVIGTRSFGATADLVARHGAAFVAGLQGAGVAACAKHFPGHGSTHTDSHLALPTVARPGRGASRARPGAVPGRGRGRCALRDDRPRGLPGVRPCRQGAGHAQPGAAGAVASRAGVRRGGDHRRPRHEGDLGHRRAR